jgi:hypothetical protein
MGPRDRDYRVLTWILMLLAMLVIGSYAMVIAGLVVTRSLAAAAERLQSLVGARLFWIARHRNRANRPVYFPASQICHQKSRA